MKSRGLETVAANILASPRGYLNVLSFHFVTPLSLLHQTSHSTFIPMHTRWLKRATKVFASVHCVAVCHLRASAQFFDT